MSPEMQTHTWLSIISVQLLFIQLQILAVILRRRQ